ncbi:MAG: pyridoxal phosphate-dependent aminotransferase [Alphaproteobacteria bacterium]
MSFIADRLKAIKPSPTLAVTAKAKALKSQGVKIIDFGVGEPDFDTPDFIKDAAKKALDNGKTKYTPVPGIVALREAICAKLKKENNLDYDISEVSVGCGGKQTLYNALMATINPEDEVILPAPYWVSYAEMVALAGGKKVIVECKKETGFRLTPDLLEQAITPKTKWVIINSPSNPTGVAYKKDELTAIAEVLRKYPHVGILSDDIYEHLVYDDFKFVSILNVAPDLKNRTLVFNGLSKSFAMTGWRVGYVAGPKEIIKAINDIQSHSTSHTSSISQEASVAALNGSLDFLKERNEIFKQRRDIIVEGINSIKGLSCLKPEGAFYVYVSCEGAIGKKTEDNIIIENDTDFVTQLLEKAGVAVVQGEAFGLSPYFRISYATSTEDVKLAIKKINDFCISLR